MSSFEERIKNLSPQKRALLEQRRAAAAMAPQAQASEALAAEPLAIVGVGCRYPGGVEDLASFAAMLARGEDAVGEIPRDRWDVDAHFSPDPAVKGKMISRRGGFLPDVKGFDADFFGISPREAEMMDPQQRLLLEVSYEAFEDAGIPLASLEGSTTGVYVGITLAEYGDRLVGDPRDIDVYTGTGNYLNVAAGRLSYVYGLQGPCMAIDAACASSLVTLHLAAQALRHRECDLALAGGVSLMLAPETTIYLSQTGALAPDGRCKTFDAKANGYVRAEGCGLLVLKRLSDAVRAGDRIHALVRGSAVSQDGASSGLTVPNGLAQQKVIRAALRDAGARADEVTYVEAHGTGTPLGDPIEMGAIGEVYGARNGAGPLYVGSLKTNIGHAEAAAGVGGVIKSIVALQQRRIPAHLHFEKLNPLISVDPQHVRVPAEPVAWALPAEKKRLAGVSSFGFSGVIAHLLLEEAAPMARGGGERHDATVQVLPVTARHPSALRGMLASIAREIEARDDQQLGDLCATACLRRSHHVHRAWFAFRSKAELLAQLEAARRDREVVGAVMSGAARKGEPSIVMVFPGQGSQWVGMGRQLMREYPVFREAIQQIASAMQPWAKFSLLEVLAATDDEALSHVSVIQPTLFAVQVALARLWESWGVVPHAVIGHSMGEVAAACVTGALSLDDAAAVICRRSQLVTLTSGRGAMALVELPAAEVEEAIAGYGERLAIAAYNGPSTVLLSGEPDAIDEALALLQARGAFCRRVKVDYASHCAQMDPLLERIRDELGHLRPRTGRVPLYSTARGAPLEGDELDANYWAENLRQPVRFHAQIAAAMADGMNVFLEISPHPVLGPAMQKTIDEAGGEQLVLACLRREEDEALAMATSLGRLFAHGQAVRFAALCDSGASIVDLPRYAWQRRELWKAHKAAKRGAAAGATAAGYPQLGAPLRPAFGAEAYYWELEVSAEEAEFLAEHRVRGMTVFPGTAYLDLALAAARRQFGEAARALLDVSFHAALTLDTPRRLQLSFVREADDFAVTVASRGDDSEPWQLHASMRMRDAAEEAAAQLPVAEPGCERRDSRAHYRAMQEGGLDYGPAFRGVSELWCKEASALARLSSAKELGLDGSSHLLHPALWDAAHQVLASALAHPGAPPSTWIPLGVERCVVHRAHDGASWVKARAALDEDGGGARGELVWTDEAGEVVLEVSGLRLQRRDADGLDDLAQWFLRPTLEALPALPGSPARAAVAAGTWRLVGEADDVRAQLAEAMRRAGLEVLLDEESDQPLAGLVLLRPYQLARRRPPLEDLARDIDDLTALYAETLEHARVLQRTAKGSPALVVVSALDDQADLTAPALVSAPLQGLMRVITAELPQLRALQLSLAGADLASELAAVVRELGDDEMREDELVLAGDSRWARRLERGGAPLAASSSTIHGDATYLITGGLGGLGLTVAAWLVERGATSLVLTGRSAPSAAATAQLDALRARGASITVRAVDVSAAHEMAALFDELSALPALRGVLHLAGVLDDATLAQQDAARFAAARRPKLDGAWLLHQHTRQRELDFFVCFSAGAALLGSAGQANYAAANAYLDALAMHRRRLGLPALSLAWGAWDEVGLAAASSQRGARLAERGLYPIRPSLGMQALERALASPLPMLAILPIRLATWRDHHPEIQRRSLFQRLLRELPGRADAFEEPILDRLRHAAGGGERKELLRRWVAEQVAQVLRRDPSTTPREQAFSTMGVDSLMALELRNRLERALALRLQPTMIFHHPTVEALSAFLEQKLEPAAAAPVVAPAAAAPAAPRLDERDGAALLGALSKLKKLTRPA